MTTDEPADTADRPQRRVRFRHRLREQRKRLRWWQELGLLMIIAICLAVVLKTFLVEPFLIPSGSMEQTLRVGDRVLVNKLVYDYRDPVRGEVVVFRGTAKWAPEDGTGRSATGNWLSQLGRGLGDLVGIGAPGETDFIKRVIGLPGDIVACCDVRGRVIVNGYPLDEGYLYQNSSIDAPPSPGECRSRRFGPVTVAAGQVFVMGDHRLVSQDARCQGPVPIRNIVGRAIAVAWPVGHWRTLPVPATFHHVPAPIALGRPVPARPG